MVSNNTTVLPERKHARPPTHQGMPHAQIGIQPVAAINAELFRRSFSLPNVQNRPTVISVPGARALWLTENVSIAHPEVIARGREFAHMHPDGSLHLSLPPDRAREAVDKGWAEPHPIASYLGIEGMVMLYTPLDEEELEVVFQLIVESYDFITGSSIQPDEIGQEVLRRES